ncbi:Oxygen-independent coproporphyrinogen III oxidase (fragment) [Vibrio tapetis subsp. tapetis]|uniref:Oxygen-independent coproporphyrinogen III oxidase n=1 Tax=Vibrio tapetis subsp. tapetis TaxID=1671868 RepID=A0A2N8ZNA6_9VIBR
MRSAPDRAITSFVKSAMDRGVITKKTLNMCAGFGMFEMLLPLFVAWQNNGLTKLSDDYVELTLAGEFWATTLAQNLIQVIQSGAMTTEPDKSSTSKNQSPNNNKIKAVLA